MSCMDIFSEYIYNWVSFVIFYNFAEMDQGGDERKFEVFEVTT